MLLFAALHHLSWLAFLGLFLWAGVVGLPRHGALILSCLLWYVLGYWLLRGVVGIAHACRSAAVVLPPQEAVVIRRVILEEITPDTRQRRIVLHDLPISDERNGHAR